MFEKSSLSFGSSRLASAPGVRAFAILTIVLCSWVFYARLHFYRDPGSRFYDESRAFEQRYSSFRIAEARAYLETLESPVSNELIDDHNSSPIICSVMLSVPRPNGAWYLDEALASAVAGQSRAERSAIRLSTFLATSDPQAYIAFRESKSHKLVDVNYTYENALSPSQRELALALESRDDTSHKQSFDYATALNLCKDTKAKYFAIFEDDIIFAKGWLARTLVGLRSVEKRMESSGRKGKWLYLRLFNQERSTGWASKRIGGNKEIEISAAIALVMGIVYFFGQKKLTPSQKTRSRWTLLVLLLYMPVFVVLFFQSGKASMLPPRPGVREEFFGCCSQALVFNREHVDGLAEYITNHSGEFNYDMLTRDYAWIHSLARWSQYPMMVQHVGTVSTLATLNNDSQKTWSMAFEDLQPARLESELHKNLDEAFPFDYSLSD